MNDWQIVLLHTHQTTLLQRAFEAAFPGRVVSMHVGELARQRKQRVRKPTLTGYFRQNIYDPGIWNNGRVLTVYGDGWFHHWTYALTQLALNRRGIGDWTYFHFDQHRDDWGRRGKGGISEIINCASFVDQIAYDHRGIPFFIGPQAYPKKDSTGYVIRGTRIPIYHNYFTKKLQRSRQWHNNVNHWAQTGLELPAAADLRATPKESYFSFDLDLLSYSEIVTNYDQNGNMTLRRLCRILDKVRPFKRVFSADILGFPDWNYHHALSCLTMVILARKIMGLGTERLLRHHARIKRTQAARINMCREEPPAWDYWQTLMDMERESPIEEGELLEILG